MEGFDPRTSFGDETSKRYDAAEARGDERETVSFLAELAGQGGALEFAIGTGRIALPLKHAGVQVDGIEQSRHMVDRIREKAGGEDVHVVIGDMARTSMGRKYRLVYLVYNTIGNLLTQDDQVRCFENAARHMTDDGVFVLECRVPTAPVRPGHQFVNAERVAADEVTLDIGRYDPVTQLLDENHMRISRRRHLSRCDQPPPGQPARVRPDGAHRGSPAPSENGGLARRAVHRVELAPRQRVRARQPRQ